MNEKVWWWCPKCRAPVTTRTPCPTCKSERVNSWKCDSCGSIVVSKPKCKCGRKRSTVIYNRILVKKLFEEVGPSGHTNVEILRRYAYQYAFNKRIPQYLVEDAIAATFEKLVKGIKSYDPSRPFRTWATAILKNALMDAARKDASRNEGIALRLDSVRSGDDDGALTMETVLGYTYGAEDLIAAEEKERFIAMAALARKTFGYYSTVVGGEYAELSIYDLCVQCYTNRDGSGWKAMAARIAGVSKQVLQRRQTQARETWKTWQGIESEGL